MPDALLLSSLRVGSVIAPAGHGKTEAIAKTAKLCARALILTHTHAGVHALRGRLKRLGVSSRAAVVDTIDGWCMRYVRAFPRHGQPPEGMPVGAQWTALRTNALNLLEIAAVRDVVRSSYDRILIDEYQDCDPGQHALAIGLSAIVPTVVFGDPMQGIFEFANARLRWTRDVYPTFPLALTLDRPHRWSKHPELGAWIADARDKLMGGELIDLASGPVTYRRADAAFDLGAFFEGVADRDGSIAAIHCRRGMCDNLARATRGTFQSIEEVAARRLTSFAAAWDRCADAQARVDALMALVADCFHRRPKLDNETFTPEQLQVIEDMKSAAHRFGSDDRAEAARSFMRLARRHPRWRAFRYELWRDAERAMAELAAARAETLVDAALRVRHRMSSSGRSLQRRTISTPLLLKGLEFDHVLIPDAPHFGLEDYAQAKLFYVAISRATQSLTITAPDRYVQFSAPEL